MKTYHKTIFRIKGLSYDEGFLAIEYSEDSKKIKSIDGIFTTDFITARPIGDKILFEYFVPYDSTKMVMRIIFLVYLEQLEKAFDVELTTIDGNELKISADNQEKDFSRQAFYEKKLNEFRENHVFIR